MQVTLLNVHRVVAKGRVYYYHRPTKTKLTENPGSPAFIRRVAELNAQLSTAVPKFEPGEPGTMANLLLRYKESMAFKKLAPGTRADYRRYLDFIGQAAGSIHGEKITTGRLLDLRDKFAANPRKANYLILVFRRVLAVAVQREWISHCPALQQRQEKLTEGAGYKPWPDVAIQRFRNHAPAELVLAMELALYTGQRQGDLLAMQWGQINDGLISITQSKTGAVLAIPVHRDLAKILESVDRRSVLVLTSKTGRPWRPYTFRAQFGNAVRDCGLKGLVFHGLRHTAATRLAELGASDKVIAAITGHASTASVHRYTRAAAQKKLAKIAVETMEQS